MGDDANCPPQLSRGEITMANYAQNINELELIMLYSKHITDLIEKGIGNKTIYGARITQRMLDTIINRRDVLKHRYTRPRHSIIDNRLDKRLEGKTY